jgi:glycosyltransferase involved in cell wall biosynthesis
MSNRKILFISTVGGWESCEELWSQAALDLTSHGFDVSASVIETAPVHPRVKLLGAGGLDLRLRPTRYPLWKRILHRAFSPEKSAEIRETDRLLREKTPRLVVISEGLTYPPLDLLELCVSKNLPFVTISHLSFEHWCPEDPEAEGYRKAFVRALRCYFVSEGNLRLTRNQLGIDFSNAEVIRNPYNVDFNASLAWPALEPDGELRMACVGRLFPPHKGQDVLFEVLASPAWAKRNWHLTLYGKGQLRNSLERLAANFGLSERVTFAGFVNSIEDIWTSNHVLVMPSRFEGMPLAMVEAMLCARPVLTTNVGGHSEIVADGVTGFLSESPTVASWARDMERLWTNRSNLENMGKAGGKRIRELVPADPGRVFSEKLRLLIS